MEALGLVVEVAAQGGGYGCCDSDGEGRGPLGRLESADFGFERGDA